MSGKRIFKNSDICEMTVIPGIIIDTTRITLMPMNNQNTLNNINLFTQPSLSKPIRLNALKRLITLINKPLSHDYDSQIAKFKSFYTPLLHFLKNDAFHYEKLGNTCTSLFFDQETSALVAFCSTKCSSLKVKGNTILSLCPSVEIAALCVDDKYRYQGIGQAILHHVLHQIQTIRNVVGVQLITLFAVPPAVDFYKKFGFKKLGTVGKTLYAAAHQRCVPMYVEVPQKEISEI